MAGSQDIPQTLPIGATSTPATASGAGSVALTVLLELVAELSEADTEEFGGARLDPAGTRQGHLQVPVLDLIERGLEIDAIGGDLHGNFLKGARLLEIRREGVGLEHVPAAEHQRSLDHVLELTNIAGPTVVLEDRERLRADALHGFPELGRDFPDEMRGQERDVFPALAERWQLDGNDVEPIEEVLAQDPVGHRLGHVAIRGGDQPHVDLDVARVADAADLALLNRAQEL